jgi:hypothetical protein
MSSMPKQRPQADRRVQIFITSETCSAPIGFAIRRENLDTDASDRACR